MLDVLLQKSAGGGNIALSAQFKDLVVFFVGALDAVGEIQLQPRVALTTVIDVADDGHEMGPLGARIQKRMKLPVEAPPGEKMVFVLEFAFVTA